MDNENGYSKVIPFNILLFLIEAIYLFYGIATSHTKRNLCVTRVMRINNVKMKCQARSLLGHNSQDRSQIQNIIGPTKNSPTL